ncbi:MAG TPA: hypothetical protein VGD98_05490 [Ktedonobacteraceae bacterium]
MPTHSRGVFGFIIGVSLLMIIIVGFHLGNETVFKIGDFSPLVGAFIGGIFVLVCVNIPFSLDEGAEPWLKREQIAWNLVGCGCLAWALGECFWRYYLSQNQSPFPSLADFGYAFLPALCFTGLLFQPLGKSSRKRIFLALDSLIAMGALLSIAWFVLLGSLVAVANESGLAKFLGLYYPIADIALLSCILFLLLGGPNSFYQSRTRRISLLVLGTGLAIFALSDFVFNVEQNLGTFVEESWSGLGWPLGIMIIGVAAYLRRFLPRARESAVTERSKQDLRFGLLQMLPYVLLGLLFCVLIFNVISVDPAQQRIRSVLLVATIVVTSLVVVRQILTMLENERLVGKQADTLKQLEMVYQDIEKRQNALETGITHLKDVQTRLANGDNSARAQNVNNDLWPLAAGLNLMADRMMRADHMQRNSQRLSKAVSELDQALKRKREGGAFVPPLSCSEIPETQSLMRTLGLVSITRVPRPNTQRNQSQAGSLSQSSSSDNSGFFNEKPGPASGKLF